MVRSMMEDFLKLVIVLRSFLGARPRSSLFYLGRSYFFCSCDN